MFKQIVLAFGLIAASQASFIAVVSENIVSFKGIPVYSQTKGFVAYEGGLSEWSASVDTHPSTAKTLTTSFSGFTFNTGGISSSNHLRLAIAHSGDDWGEYDLMQIKSSYSKTWYAVCHKDSNTNYCGSDNWQSMTKFATEHI